MIRHLVLLCLAVVAAVPSLRGSAAQPTVARLLDEAPQSVQADRLAMAVQRPDTVQARAVAVDVEALDADLVEVPVAPDRTLAVRLDRRVANPDGSESWSGHIDGAPLSAATFVRSAGVVQGSLRTLDAAYSLEPLDANGLHVLREVNLQAMGEELPPRLPAPALAAADPPPASGDDGTVFDVLAVYTAAARSAAGSDASILARINLGITETNTAYANSGVIPRLRLVGAEAIAYTESGDLGNDLDAVTGTGDGQMDAVHARRNALGADLVTLIVGDTAGGACGVAWLMTALSSGFAGNAFSVTAYPCISPNYTFGHELGHNLGSHHAPEDGASGALYAYSFGYKNPGNAFRTVMAYNCASGGCPRVLYFSNPSVMYSGLATGTVAQHNNALSINNARHTIANWRQATITNTAPTISAITNRTTAEDTPTAAIAFTVGDAQTSPGSLTVTAASSNTAVVASTSAALALGGSGASRTLVVTPQPDASGISTITVTVSDGQLTASSTFQLTVTAVNDPPVVSAIGSQTTLEDQPLSVAFTVSDAETPAASLTVQATSSNQTLVAASGIGHGGSGGSRILTLAPRPNEAGTTTITLSVGDGTTTTQRTFTLLVSASNDAPAFVSLAPLVSTVRGVPVVLGVTVSDPDSTSDGLSLSVVSGNTTLLPPSGINVAPTGVTSSTRYFEVTLTPASGRTGTSTLTLTAGDGSATTSAPVVLNVTAAATAPDPPTSFTATAEGLSVTFSWTPALTGSAPAYFAVEIGTAVGTTNLPGPSVPWPGTRATQPMPAGTYYARVRAVNGAGTSAPSAEASVVVTEPSPIPGPPGNFFAQATGRTVSFFWTASVSGTAATSYRIEAGSGPGLANLAQLDTGSAASSFAVPNVPPGTYWVRVRGVNAAGTGAPSQDVAIVMGASSGCVGLPGAPVLLTPVVTGHDVSLNWNMPIAGPVPSGYVLMAGSAAGAADLAYFNTGSTATSFSASAPAGLYFVRVAGANSCGVGVVSNEVSFTLGAELPGRPGDISWSVTAGGGVSLSWTAPAGGPPPTAYVVEAGSANGRSDLATVSTGSPGTSFAATAPPGTYYVRVRAVNGAGAGPPSAEAIVTVP